MMKQSKCFRLKPSGGVPIALMRYACICRVDRVMQPYLEALT